MTGMLDAGQTYCISPGKEQVSHALGLCSGQAGVSGPIKNLVSKWRSNAGEKEGKGFPVSARTLLDADNQHI